MNKRKYTKNDISNIQSAYNKKIDEYSKLSLDELKELYPRLGGTYRKACIEVVKIKLDEAKYAKLEEVIKDNKENIKQNEEE